MNAPNVSPDDKEREKKLPKRLTWKQGSEGGRTADGNVVLISPPALGNRLAFYYLFFCLSFSLSARRITSSRFSKDCTPCFRRSTAEKTFRSSRARPQSRYPDQRLLTRLPQQFPCSSGVGNAKLRLPVFIFVSFLFLFCSFLPRLTSCCP